MRLTAGQIAPDFTSVDVTGRSISLNDYGNSYLLLSFFRYAGCPFCNITLTQLVQRYDNFVSRGLKAVVFFQSDDESINKYVSAKHPPFPVVADAEKRIYDVYGVESSKLGAARSIRHVPRTAAAIIRGETVQGSMDGDKFLMPAQFIIGPDKTIVKAHYGTDFSDKIPIFEIEELILSQLQKT